MNFLAHLHLSGNDPSLMVGNFIGDFIKGKSLLSQLDASIVKGIELHRAIDAYTDHHPVVAQSKNRLRPVYRHYSGVIVDVFYDHFLARSWPNYHPQPLEGFARNAYDTLLEHHAILPDTVKQMLPYMIKGNWLVHYGDVEGIQRALTGMARRTPYVSKMEEAVNDLRKYYDDFRAEFELFYPALVQHAQSFRENS